jgi:photosystem II stability/assembly factor-like uncharacterized protein
MKTNRATVGRTFRVVRKHSVGHLVRSLNPLARLALTAALTAFLCASSAGVAETGTGVWTRSGLQGEFITSLVIDPQNLNTLYAGADSQGVFKSTDAGVNWSAVNTGLTPFFGFPRLAIDPLTPSTLYAAARRDVGVPTIRTFKSTNGAGSWSPTAPLRNVSVLAIDPLTPTTLYAGTTGDGGIFKSTDGAENWSAVNTGLTDFFVTGLVIDPLTPNTLYAGAGFPPGGAIFKSINGGGNWTALFRGNFTTQALAIDPTNPSTIYAGTFPAGVFKSTDGGVNWRFTSIGLTDPLVSVLALVINSLTPTTLYAGMRGGVFKSTDGGESWSPLNDGLTNLSVQTLAIEAVSPTILYAGTGDGVFVFQEAPVTPPGPIPTLSESVMILLAAFLALVGVAALGTRKV